MAAFINSAKQTSEKSAVGSSLQCVGIVLFLSALFLAVHPGQSLEGRDVMVQAGWFTVVGWFIQQGEARYFPLQSYLINLWEKRWGNLFLSLTLASVLALTAILLINIMIRIAHS